MKHKVLYITLLIFCFAVLGYFREFFFVQYNNLMYIKYYGKSGLPLAPLMEFFVSFSYKTLYYLKYIFSFMAIILFCLLSALSIKVILNEKKLIKWVIYSYIVLLTLAALSMLYGYFIYGRLQDDEYTLSRWLIGIAQSPIITLVILASYKLYIQQTKSSST